jgi:hypothetical protein
MVEPGLGYEGTDADLKHSLMLDTIVRMSWNALQIFCSMAADSVWVFRMSSTVQVKPSSDLL